MNTLHAKMAVLKLVDKFAGSQPASWVASPSSLLFSLDVIQMENVLA